MDAHGAVSGFRCFNYRPMKLTNCCDDRRYTFRNREPSLSARFCYQLKRPSAACPKPANRCAWTSLICVAGLPHGVLNLDEKKFWSALESSEIPCALSQSLIECDLFNQFRNRRPRGLLIERFFVNMTRAINLERREWNAPAIKAAITFFRADERRTTEREWKSSSISPRKKTKQPFLAKIKHRRWVRDVNESSLKIVCALLFTCCDLDVDFSRWSWHKHLPARGGRSIRVFRLSALPPIEGVIKILEGRLFKFINIDAWEQTEKNSDRRFPCLRDKKKNRLLLRTDSAFISIRPRFSNSKTSLWVEEHETRAHKTDFCSFIFISLESLSVWIDGHGNKTRSWRFSSKAGWKKREIKKIEKPSKSDLLTSRKTAKLQSRVEGSFALSLSNRMRSDGRERLARKKNRNS